jgi:hypothetical protein
MSGSHSTDNPAATMPQRCKHILVPGQAHCLLCREQILYTGLERTRWQRFTAWVAGWFVFIMADHSSTTLPSAEETAPTDAQTPADA